VTDAPDADVAARQTTSEITHWRHAAETLADLETVAAPEAWAALEGYLQRQVRERLCGVITAVAAEGRALEQQATAAHPAEDLRRRALRLRRRYLQVETVVDFYADAVNTRTNPVMRDLLAGFDVLASDSMAASLTPLGIDPPPALVYVDKGLGAAILRAGVRLWDQAHPSPAAAIKLTRHNLSQPTALLHETGHQVGHLTGWNGELADNIERALRPRSREVAEVFASWASEIAADVHAFAQSGWAPLSALSNVVDGPTASVFHIRIGDPHPVAWIRVMFNVVLCRSWFGPGPWDDLARAWEARHPPARAGRLMEPFIAASLPALGDLVEVCTRRQMDAFRGASLSRLLDPRRVAPASLRSLEQTAGPSLLTSRYLRRREPLRILALLATRAITDPGRSAHHWADLAAWVRSVASDAPPHTTTRAA
jgi:hypothetical protein